VADELSEYDVKIMTRSPLFANGLICENEIVIFRDMVDKFKIEELEIKLSEVQKDKVNSVRSQRYEKAVALRLEENRLFAELEELTNAEYLKTKWNVINDNKGH